jgi:hypothetical protein
VTSSGIDSTGAILVDFLGWLSWLALMAVGFLNEMRAAPDHRAASMATAPLDEILLATLMLATRLLATRLLATLVRAVRGGDVWQRFEDDASEGLDWLRHVCCLCRATRARRRFAQCSA